VKIDAVAFRAFVRLGRPQFLVGGFVLYGLGAALAIAGGAGFDVARFAVGQLCVTATQLGTHYANDYFDLLADKANRTPTRWSGGSRVLAEGDLPPEVALAAAVGLYGAAIGFVAALAIGIAGTPIGAPLAATMIGLAWAYSAPPLRLVARGLGEVTTAAVVTFCVPLLGYALQSGTIGGPVMAAAVLPAALQFAMLLAIEFPDAAGDAMVGKRTLVVRLGAPAAAQLYALVTVAGFGALPFVARAGLPPRVAFAPLVLAPIALWQAVRVSRGAYGDPARWESVAFWSVALLAGSATAELAAALTNPAG
jgi:1,4-dihydroxy-2-naphthoate octaprenyltransferase